MKRFLHSVMLVFAIAWLAACGGGNDGGPSLTPGDNNNGQNPGDGESLVLAAGRIDGGLFFPDEISSSNSDTLETGDTTLLRVSLAQISLTTNEYTLIDQPATVTFSSNCITTGQSSVDPATVTGSTGVFTTTYTNDSCSGDDQVTASITYNDETVTATVSISTSNFVVLFGNFVNGEFVEGVISNTPTSILSAGDSAQLAVRLVDQDGNPFTGASDVFFSSGCISSGQSEIDPAIVTNTNGTILTTYTSLNCDGTDTVTATTSAGSGTLTATVDLLTEEPPLGALQFVSATPDILLLQGTEGAIDSSEDGRDIGAQSTVTFKLTSDNGQPLPNQEVAFTLVTADSGSGNDGTDAFLSRYVDFTDADGLVSTVVNPGTTSTPVRVRATASKNTDGVEQDISAVSTRLVITTGIADQDSFSLSVSTFNIDGWAYDGIETQITIRAADRFNNPVPNGTALVFWAEGAVIQDSCVTQGGVCSVTLTSQAPKPPTGRVTILARAIGEESFIDASPTNGRYDDGENYTDLPEPFLDENENCAYDSGTEKFADFNNDALRNNANNGYDGLLCTKNGVNANCSESETTFVSADTVIVLSGSTDLSVGTYLAGDYSLPPIDYCAGDAVNAGTRFPAALPVTQVELDCAQAITVAVQDQRGQVPPATTTMAAAVDQGELVGPTTYPMASTNAYGPWEETFFIAPGDGGGEGLFELTVTTPDTDGGGSTVYTNIVSVIQREFDIVVEKPGGGNLEVDAVDGATLQLKISEVNSLGFPDGTMVTVSIDRGTINGDTSFTISSGQLGTFRQPLEITPTGADGFGYITVVMTTPVVDGCAAGKSYFAEFEFEEVVPEEDAP